MMNIGYAHHHAPKEREVLLKDTDGFDQDALIRRGNAWATLADITSQWARPNDWSVYASVIRWVFDEPALTYDEAEELDSLYGDALQVAGINEDDLLDEEGREVELSDIEHLTPPVLTRKLRILARECYDLANMGDIETVIIFE